MKQNATSNQQSTIESTIAVGKPKEQKVQPKIKGDYESRKLNYCHFCGEKYNVGEKIPRILVHCGHTFCT